MKTIALFVMLILCVNTFSQTKVKTVNIHKNAYGEYLDCMFVEENGKSLPVIHLYALDHKYQSLKNLITLYKGSPSGFYSYILDAIDFFNENEPVVTSSIQGRTVSVRKNIGMKVINLYEEKKDIGCYHRTSGKILEKFKSRFLEWCDDNKVDVEKDRNVLRLVFNTKKEEDNQIKNDSNVKSKADRLKELKELLDSGILTQEEFNSEKKKILDE